MRNRTKTLCDVFPDWLSGGGIFAALNSYDVPWKPDISAQFLDTEYFGNKSGNKSVSPLIPKLMEGETLTSQERGILAQTILAVNLSNWSKLWETMSFQYNPIENYHMVETMTDDETVTEYGKTMTRTNDLVHAKTGTETTSPDLTTQRTDDLTDAKTGTETDVLDGEEERTDNLTHSKEGTETTSYNTTDERTDDLTHDRATGETITPNLTETTTPNLTSATTNKVYGFNSATASNADESSTSSSGTSTLAKTGLETHAGTDILNETGTVTNEKTGTDTVTFDLDETDTGTVTTQRDDTNTKTYDISETHTGTQTETHTGTDELEYDTQETDTGTVEDAAGGSDTQTRNYTLERSGNIGVTTSQQMITSERELWVWNFFYDVVFPAIDRVLALPIYSY